MKKKVIIISIFLFTILIFHLYYNHLEQNYQLAITNLNNLIEDNYEQTKNSLTGKKDTLLKKFSSILKDTDLSIDNISEYESNLNKEYENQKTKNNALKEEKSALQTQKNTLQTQYDKLIKKYTYKIPNVKTINQYSQGYPTGCESAALTILLNFYDVKVSMSDVVNKLKKGKKPYYENGTLYGANPYLEFVGNPSDSGSYGTYEQAIKEVANIYKPGIIDGTGKSLDEILEIVEEGRPVIVWNSMNLAVPYVSRTWIHKATGKKIKWIANEHALVVVGFNQNQVIVSDSLNGKIKYFNRATFESRYKAYGKRALYY